jgi:phage tail sheath protein FI
MALVHGVETVEVNTPSGLVRVVKSAVIYLIGTDYKDAETLNTPILCNNASDDALYFGNPDDFQDDNYTIPHALKFIRAQGGGAATIIVMNVFDRNSMTYEIEEESHAITNRKITLDYYPLSAVVVTNVGGSTTYTLGTDYTISGRVITIINNALANGVSLLSTYDAGDTDLVTGTEIIGSTSTNTGIYGARRCYTEFGLVPKIFICPEYSQLPAVASALTAEMSRHKAICIIDSEAQSRAQSITDRNNPAKAFGTASERAFLCYPKIDAYWSGRGENYPFWYSQFIAGVISATDNNPALGFHYSPSNQPIQLALGTQFPVTCAPNDSAGDTDASLLNAAGITTVFGAPASGLKVWGNYSASHPSVSNAYSFLCVRRTMDIVHESLEFAALQFIDKPITQSLIDAIRASGNDFVRTLIARGALLPGSKITYDPARNSPAQIAAGRLTFGISAMVPTPNQIMTYESFLDISLLSFQ